MGGLVQRASIAAWNDEAHVVANRELYRAKFAQVTPLLARVLDVATAGRGVLPLGRPARGNADDVEWARGLLAQYNVQVLPGSLLARTVAGHQPANPGQGRVRLALVAPVAECLEAARRIVSYQESLR